MVISVYSENIAVVGAKCASECSAWAQGLNPANDRSGRAMGNLERFTTYAGLFLGLQWTKSMQLWKMLSMFEQ
jgi:hypothetical protein